MQICNHTFMRISWAVDKQMEPASSPALQPLMGARMMKKKAGCSGIVNGLPSYGYIGIHMH